MTEQRFIEVLVEEGYTVGEARELLDSRPPSASLDLPDAEERARSAARKMLPTFVASRRVQ